MVFLFKSTKNTILSYNTKKIVLIGVFYYYYFFLILLSCKVVEGVITYKLRGMEECRRNKRV